MTHMTLTLVIETKILCLTHFLILVDLSVKFDEIYFSRFEFYGYAICKAKDL